MTLITMGSPELYKEVALVLFTLAGTLTLATVAFMLGEYNRKRPAPMNADETQHHNEVVATAMLLGDVSPIICSGCLGKGRERVPWGGFRRCPQCDGWGFDYIGPLTRKALGAYSKR